MAKQTVGIGSAANDGTGDTLRAGADKINDNFDEIYNALGTGTTLTVPFDQIIRCLNWTNNFEVYKTRHVILAFKFLSKKRIGVGEYEKRELREFYKVWNSKKNPIDIVCRYDGSTYALREGKKKKLSLKDYEMPFVSRYQKI